MIKRLIQIVGITLILSFTFLGTEFLLYSLFIKDSKLFFPSFILFLLIVALLINTLNRIDLMSKHISPMIVLLSVLIGLGGLRLIV